MFLSKVRITHLIKISAVTATILAASFSPSLAQEEAQSENNTALNSRPLKPNMQRDTRPVVCNRLKDRDYYDELDLSDFKMMVNGEDGWLYRSRLDLKYRFRLTERTLDSFYRLGDAFRYHGSDVVLAMMPTRGITAHTKLDEPWATSYDAQEAFKNYNIMLKELRGTGMHVAQLKDPLNINDFYYPRDNHWTHIGAEAMAEAVAEEVKKIDVYKDIPRKSFRSYPTEIKGALWPNQYEDIANQICGYAPSETFMPEVYVTEEVGGSEELSEDSLFGDSVKPEIAILGTSNSTNPDPSYSNFEGFLKEHAEVDVNNKAISGGSLQGAISRYLISGEYHQDKPKIVVWEMAAYYGYNQQDFFREIIPATYGTCEGKNVIKEQTTVPLDVESEDGETIVLEDLEEYGLSDHTAYVVLNFDDTSARNIKVRFEHSDGRRDTVGLERPRRSFEKNNGRYFAEVSDLMEAPVKNIVVQAKKVTGKVTVQLCRAPKPVEPRPSELTKKDAKKEQTIWDQNKKFSLFDFLFGRNDIDIAVADTKDAPAKTIELPSLEKYTKENILAKIPASTQEGKIEIARMEGAPPLRKYAFDKRLIEMRNIQGRVQPLAVHIYSGTYTFQQLAAAVAGTSAIKETDEAYIVRLPIALYPEASLIIKDLDKPIYLSQDKGGFLVSAGDLFILDTEITGWNEANAKPAKLNKDWKNFRPFITTWDGSKLYIADSTINNLGYALSKSYGITVSTNNVEQEEFFDEFGDLPVPTGWIINTDFNHMYFGFYSYEAEDVVLYKNRYTDNVIYGIDPHDRSERLIIANNYIKGTKKKHGIIISREVNNSYIMNNTTEYNAGSGIMLDRHCQNTIVANNIVQYNKGDGITLYESPNNTLYKNTVIHNEANGVRLRNSWGVDVVGGRIALNKDQAIIAYQDTLRHTNRDFEMDPVTPRVEADFSNVALESNGGILKTKGFAAITFRDMKWDLGTLTSRNYYGELKNMEDEINTFAQDNPSFTLISENTAGEPIEEDEEE